MIAGPPEVRALCPRLEPTFWALPEHPSESLWGSEGAWIRVLPVVREDDADADRFRQVVLETARRLAAASETDPGRWPHLVQFVWNWSLNRREEAEAGVIGAELGRIFEATRQKSEVQAMVKTAAESLIERGIEQGLEKGLGKGLEQGLEQGLERGREENLKMLRSLLTRLLSKRFGEIPKVLAKRIERETDSDVLQRAILAVNDAKSPRDVKLSGN